MKNFYQYLSKVIVVIFLASIPFVSIAQDKANEKKEKGNAAPSHSYWSIGVFGGPMQFNGDLSRNLFFNLFPQCMGYNVGLVATKQFNRVLGLRARIAYGVVQSRVEGKFVWEYLEGNGIPQYISQSFKTNIFESELQLTVNWSNWILGYKPERIVSSYFIFGLGMDQSKGTKRDINLNQEISYLGKKGDDLNVGNTNGMGGSDLQLKMGAGIGLEININKHFSIPVEVYWRWQKSDLLDMTLGGAQAVVNDMYSSATVGLTYKFAYCVDKVKKDEAILLPAAVPAIDRPFRFFVNAPRNLPVERRVREIFPLRNYIFFNTGSTAIPDRYVLLTKGQVKDFKEDQLESFRPINLSGRSERQMVVYYNILNILGDRLVKNPNTTIKLVGSSEKGTEDGLAMAESVRQYLVDVFGINASRILTEGRNKPKIPSEQPGGTRELDLLREGDRRVSIESSSPSLLMEFQSGPDAPLKPVEIIAMQTNPFDSYVTFNVEAEKATFSSWSIAITDETGMVQNFGPYTQEWASIPGKSILGTRLEGNYTVTMTGQRMNGQIAKRDTTVHLVLWTPPKDEEMMRFSIIYEFNNSKAIAMYEKYLTQIVIPKIPEGGTVIIHGYTDNIGDESYNQKLSLARANDVREIFVKELSKENRIDVKFEVYGFGEDPEFSPFENKFPEERFYNRTVIIDIIPRK
jgi:outer membrane protein OmpA-like peptidoglycan-associated protein